jgi:tRNA(Ile)-lysidine synthase
VSGGIDSVALLRLLLELRGELGIVLSVVHFNHKLRGEESDADERFVADLATTHGLEFLSDRDDVAEHADREGVSVEAAARELRYGFFRYLLGSEGTSGAEASDQNGHAKHSAQNAAPPNGAELILDVEVLGGSQNPHPVAKNATRMGHPSGRYLLDKIVTGHTLDDQAETVLLRLIRGAGIGGLSAIHPRVLVEDDDGALSGEIVRPLLNTRRRELEHYLKELGQLWREDSTNADHAFTRNRLRKLVLPLLEKEFNPSVAENLAELAEIARGEEEYWENEVAGWMGTAVHWVDPDWARPATQKSLVQISSGTQPFSLDDAGLASKIESAPWLVANASVSRPWLLSEPLAVQRRVVKAIGEHAGIPLEFKHVEEILRFAAEEEHSGGEVTLPLAWKLVRHPEELLFVTPDLRDTKPPQNYERELPVPGRVALPEIGLAIEARRVPPEVATEYNPDQLLDAHSLPGSLWVRNWRAGDRFWPAHTKSPKKIKELLQERHVAQPERALWPVVATGDQIVWVRGFATHARHGARPNREAVLITEAQLGERAEM